MPRTKRNPMNTGGMKSLVKTLSESSVEGCIEALEKGCKCEVVSSLDLEGDYTVTAEGELLIAASAKTNLPTEPVAGELGANLMRRRGGTGDGTLKVHFMIQVSTPRPSVTVSSTPIRE
jgi:hypothetical protein